MAPCLKRANGENPKVKVVKYFNVGIFHRISHEKEKDGRGTGREEAVRKYLKWFNMGKWEVSQLENTKWSLYGMWETKEKPWQKCREGSEYHFICYVTVILHSSHTFSLVESCQIGVAEGPSQQEEDLFPLLTGAVVVAVASICFGWVISS